MIRTAFLMAFLPFAASAADVTVENPVVPLAPPAAMVHAAYFTLTNVSNETRQLIGVEADGYMMAHVHKTEVNDDIASMVSVEVLELAPGQSIAFEQGGLHVMLMRPESPLEEGGTVDLTLQFANGDTLPVSAVVVPMKAMHQHGS